MLTSDLLLQAQYDCHGLVQDEQLGLGLLALQVQLGHVTQLFERLVDVTDTKALAGVVGHPSLPLPLSLLLRTQVVLILMDAAEGEKRKWGLVLELAVAMWRPLVGII